MNYAEMRAKVLDALASIAFGVDDLPAGAQHRIKALETLFGLLKLADVEDRADRYREKCIEKEQLEAICASCNCEDDEECEGCPYDTL